MKNKPFALVVFVVAALACISLNYYIFFVGENHHYFLLHEDGVVTKGHKPLDFHKIEWRDTGTGRTFVPVIEGKVVLCKIGDTDSAMYHFDPVKFSNGKETEFGVVRLKIDKVKNFSEWVPEIRSEDSSEFEAIVKYRIFDFFQKKQS